jgi:hypothetical protein
MRGRLMGVVVLLILVGAVIWQLRKDDADTAEHTLTTLDPAGVHRIDITMKGLPPQHFERDGGHWSGNDQGRPGDLAALAGTPVSEWKDAGAFDAAKIGLAPPLAVLTLDGTRIEYGDLAALGRQRYARIGNRIAFIPAQAMPRPPRTQALPTKPIL